MLDGNGLFRLAATITALACLAVVTLVMQDGSGTSQSSGSIALASSPDFKHSADLKKALQSLLAASRVQHEDLHTLTLAATVPSTLRSATLAYLRHRSPDVDQHLLSDSSLDAYLDASPRRSGASAGGGSSISAIDLVRDASRHRHRRHKRRRHRHTRVARHPRNHTHHHRHARRHHHYNSHPHHHHTYHHHHSYKHHARHNHTHYRGHGSHRAGHYRHVGHHHFPHHRPRGTRNTTETGTQEHAGGTDHPLQQHDSTAPEEHRHNVDTHANDGADDGADRGRDGGDEARGAAGHEADEHHTQQQKPERKGTSASAASSPASAPSSWPGEGSKEAGVKCGEHLDQQQREEMRESFHLYDTNHNKRLDLKELKGAMEGLGFDDMTRLPKLLARYALLRPDSLNTQEFQRMCTSELLDRRLSEDQVQQVRSAFRVADEDGSNSMDEAELIKAINLLHLHLSHAQARAWGNQLFAAATPLHKGGIEYAQWVHLVAPYLVRCPEAVATVEHDDRGVVDSRKDLDWHKKRQGGVSAAARMVARGVIGTSIQPPIYKVIRQVPVTSKQSIEAIVRLQARVGALDRMVKREQAIARAATEAASTAAAAANREASRNHVDDYLSRDNDLNDFNVDLEDRIGGQDGIGRQPLLPRPPCTQSALAMRIKASEDGHALEVLGDEMRQDVHEDQREQTHASLFAHATSSVQRLIGASRDVVVKERKAVIRIERSLETFDVPDCLPRMHTATPAVSGTSWTSVMTKALSKVVRDWIKPLAPLAPPQHYAAVKIVQGPGRVAVQAPPLLPLPMRVWWKRMPVSHVGGGLVPQVVPRESSRGSRERLRSNASAVQAVETVQTWPTEPGGIYQGFPAAPTLALPSRYLRQAGAGLGSGERTGGAVAGETEGKEARGRGRWVVRPYLLGAPRQAAGPSNPPALGHDLQQQQQALRRVAAHLPRHLQSRHLLSPSGASTSHQRQAAAQSRQASAPTRVPGQDDHVRKSAADDASRYPQPHTIRPVRLRDLLVRQAEMSKEAKEMGQQEKQLAGV